MFWRMVRNQQKNKYVRYPTHESQTIKVANIY